MMATKWKSHHLPFNILVLPKEVVGALGFEPRTRRLKGGRCYPLSYTPNLRKEMVGDLGIEPRTPWLRARCYLPTELIAHFLGKSMVSAEGFEPSTY